jgi:hypothetical protein
MVGGLGNDIYIVNSVNDSIYEQDNQGYDIVISSTSYLLNANIEELRCVSNATLNSVRTLIGILYNTIINVVDIISIIPQSTNHLIGTCYSIKQKKVRLMVKPFWFMAFQNAMNWITCKAMPLKTTEALVH